MPKIVANYHDYFIKDGRHIGDYEGMYRDCPDPWRIEALGLRLDMKAALLLLEEGGPYSKALDVGAGLGFFSRRAAERLWRANPSARMVVSDVSATALRRAGESWSDPRVSFKTFDLLRPQPLEDAPFDLIIMAQVLWGLLEDLPAALRTLNGLLAAGGRLLVSQHFFQPGQQGYGADIVASPEDLSRLLERAGFHLLHSLECDRTGNHHWAALLEKI